MKSTAAKKMIKGGNRTGLQTSPEMAQEIVDGAMSAEPSSEGGIEDLAQYRSEYIEEGFPIGSLPSLPAAEEGQADEEQVGTAVLLDKLGERLAFERMGTRLYEALMNKCEMLGEDSSGPTLEQIRHIGEEELQHFLLLNRVITEIGGDPTIQSPSADVAGVTSLGILQILTDPRSSMLQCLQAMLTAELTDNDGWRLLVSLADNLGYQDMKNEFQAALENEELHLQNVRTWVSEGLMLKAEV
jgi:bacterioferritin (cytochrome b1)